MRRPAMKKYLFSLGIMLVGAGLIFVLMHREVSAVGRKQMHCEYFRDGGFNSQKATYCKIKDLTCTSLNMGGVSCVKS